MGANFIVPGRRPGLLYDALSGHDVMCIQRKGRERIRARGNALGNGLTRNQRYALKGRDIIHGGPKRTFFSAYYVGLQQSKPILLYFHQLAIEGGLIEKRLDAEPL
jgi:hypothetical protein